MKMRTIFRTVTPEGRVIDRVVAATCPTCGRQIALLDNGTFVSHEASNCTGSHVVWKGCAGSGKKEAGQS